MRTSLIATAFIIASLGVPTLAYAAGAQPILNVSQVQPVINTGNNVTLVNPLGNPTCSSDGTCLADFLNSILAFVIRIGTVVVILMLVFVGYKFVVAQGKEAEISAARSMLLWTVVGALVLLGSQVIASGIGATVRALGG